MLMLWADQSGYYDLFGIAAVCIFLPEKPFCAYKHKSKFHAASVVKELPFLQGTHITPLVPAEFRTLEKFFVFLCFLFMRTPPETAVYMVKTRTENYSILSSSSLKMCSAGRLRIGFS